MYTEIGQLTARIHDGTQKSRMYVEQVTCPENEGNLPGKLMLIAEKREQSTLTGK
jgi:hypothetical protein